MGRVACVFLKAKNYNNWFTPRQKEAAEGLEVASQNLHPLFKLGILQTCNWVGLGLSWLQPGVGSELRSGLGPRGDWQLGLQALFL